MNSSTIMGKMLTFLLFATAVVNQSQQQVAAQIQQQQLNALFQYPSKPSAHGERENVEINKSTESDQPFRPITFPDSDEENPHYKFPSTAPHNANLILQNANEKSTASSPPVELTRTTRFAAAMATANSDIIASRFTDDQLEYVRDFAWTMFQKSKIPSAIGNLILSPIQPQMQLSLLRTAAAGNTRDEIGSAIREGNPDITRSLVGDLRITNSVSTQLGVASAVFAKNKLKLNDSFVKDAHERSVDIIPVNFESADETKYKINNWVANATNNRIKELVTSSDGLDIQTQVVLANSIYFNGEWKYGFNDVKPEPFYTTDNLSKTVQMMKNVISLRGGTITLRNGFSGQWIELPYRGDEFSMVIILPVQRFYLDEFIRSMRTNDFSDIFKQLSSPFKKLVHLSLPKFSISSSFSLVNVLLKMGVVDLFTVTSRLPYLTTDGYPAKVQDIIQNAFLSVDEKGTIAAAATFSHVVTLSLSSAPEEMFFTADQPFLSIIVDKRNKIPIFISKIFDP